MTAFQFASNAITGSVPSEIGQLGEMMFLNLLENPGLSGTIPEELYELTKMKMMGWGGFHAGPKSSFSGTISTNIGKLSDLLRLSVGGGDMVSLCLLW